MISFNYEFDFKIDNEGLYIEWITNVILSEGKSVGEINYIFCDDEYLLGINNQYLNHDTLTDIISFDYSLADEIHGDVYISIERVIENAIDYNVSFLDELMRVLVHGVLHYCGYKDKSEQDELLMRSKEDEKIKMFHMKHVH
jgi:probable rRNA maturation factor